MRLLAEQLAGDEEEDPGCKRLVKPVEGRVVDEGHDADHDADETSQQGENHEGPSGVPVRCGMREIFLGRVDRVSCSRLHDGKALRASRGQKVAVGREEAASGVGEKCLFSQSKTDLYQKLSFHRGHSICYITLN